MELIKKTLLVAGAACGLFATATAAPITWDTPVTIAGDTDVANEGTTL